jgi:hypothetical protein
MLCVVYNPKTTLNLRSTQGTTRINQSLEASSRQSSPVSYLRLETQVQLRNANTRMAMGITLFL